MSEPLVQSKAKADADRKTIFQGLIILVAICLLAISPHFSGGASSGVNWGNEGGGVCSGDFTIYNTTSFSVANPNQLYAENCLTGNNQFGPSSDVGVLFNQVVAVLKNTGPFATTGGAEIDFRSGMFAETTSMVLNYSSFHIHGTSLSQPLNFTTSPSDPTSGGAYATCNGCGTRIVAETNAMTMLKSVPGTPSYTGNNFGGGCTRNPLSTWIDGIWFDPNALAAKGIDFASCDDGAHSLFSNLQFSSLYGNEGFSNRAMDLSGCGECMMLHDDFRLTQGKAHNTIDVVWQDRYEINDVIAYSDFQPGDTPGTQGFGMALELFGLDFKIIGSQLEGATEILSGTPSCANCGNSYHFTDTFFNAAAQNGGMDGPAHFYIAPGAHPTNLRITGGVMLFGTVSNGTRGNGMFATSGAGGTIDMFSMSGTSVGNSGAVACDWKPPGVVLTNFKTTGDNVIANLAAAPCNGWGFSVTSGVF